MNPTPFPNPFPERFLFLSFLGEGHFGRVWKARDERLDRFVAIKGLRYPGHDPAARQALDTLRREARALAQIHHPNIIQIHDWLSLGDDQYLIMQYVGGGSFDVRLKHKGPLAWHLAARYIADVGSGLLTAHAQGIIHRDVKPANMLWDADRDEALLGDFGVAGRLGESQSAAGTGPYMAPEAREGGAKALQDVFSLAATLFCLIAGELPFPGPVGELRWQMQRGLPPNDPRLRDMPQLLEEVLRAGLAAQPSRRPSLQQFVQTLRATLNLLLADTMPPQNISDPASATSRPVEVRLIVSRESGHGYLPVAATHAQPVGATRDMKKVPRVPQQVQVFTGDRVMIEASADREGYLLLFNVGPAGDLNLLHSDEAPAPPNTKRIIDDIQMTPPTGRERLVAIWSRKPLDVPLAELGALADRGDIPGSKPYRATRNMVRIKQSMIKLNPSDWQAAVLELHHASENQP